MVHSENPSAKTNEGIVSMDNNLNDFRNEVKASETQVINRTVVIRETVAEAANAMPPDELVNGVLYELELFRRGASPDQSLYRPSGVHSSGDLVPDERRSYENRL